MNRITKLAGISAIAVLLAACNSSSSSPEVSPNPPTPPPPGDPVDLTVDLFVTEPGADLAADTDNVKVNAAGTDATVIEADLALENAWQYSVMAVSELGDESISAAVFLHFFQHFSSL